MDPQEAYDIFVQAAVSSVQTNSGVSLLFELSSDQIAELKQTMRRSDTLLLAKQYIKATEAVEELKRRLANFPAGGPPPGAANSKPPAPPYAMAKNNALALVSRVKVAPANMASVARRHEAGFSLTKMTAVANSFWQSRVGRWYVTALRVGFYVFTLAPLLVLCAFIFHVWLSLAYLCMHPELIVSGFFKVALNVPSLADHVVTRMWNQVAADTTAWLWGSN